MRTNAFYQKATATLKQGGIIAYPTEGVYGLGCDPFNNIALKKLLTIKKRNPDKGLILIAASFEQLKPLLKRIDDKILNTILETWPGPYTWIFPAKKTVSKLVRGKHTSIAVRVTAHPLAKKLCQEFGGPIISTSANIEGAEPARNYSEVKKQFINTIDLIIRGRVGKLKKPTSIRDACTGKQIR